MYKNHKITLFYPCRNESHCLKKIKRSIPKIIDEVLIISNASTDDTSIKAKHLGFKVYEDNRVGKHNIGYGYANITGINNSTGDILIGLDADLTYPLDNLTEILDFFIDNNLDVVSCNRYPLDSNSYVPLKIQVGIFFLNLEVLVLYGKRVKDILSGMWLIRKSKRRDLKLTEGDWNFSPQIKLNAIKNKNIAFREYHIKYNHRENGVSKQNYLRTGIEHVFWIFKNRFSSEK